MGYDDFEGGVTLFPYYDLGGAVEHFQRKLHRAWGGGTQNAKTLGTGHYLYGRGGGTEKYVGKIKISVRSL